MSIVRVLALIICTLSMVVSQVNTLDDCPVKIPYKSWFLNPPKGLVAGFPLKMKQVHEDGYDRFCSYQRMRARGVLRFYEKNGKIKHSQDSLYFYYDPNSSLLPPEDLTPTDSFAVTKNHQVYLYASSKDASVSNTLQPLCAVVPWTSGEEIEGRTYGYGVVGMSYYDHVGSWVSAESDAIRDVLGKSAVLVAAQQKSTEGDFTEVIRYEYDLTVQGIRVERRWVDFDEWSCNVVVSVPRSGISSVELDENDPLSNQAIQGNDNPLVVQESLPHNKDSQGEASVREEVKVPETVVPSGQGAFTVGSDEWYEMYRREQKKQLRKSKTDAKSEQDAFKREQNSERREFEAEKNR